MNFKIIILIVLIIPVTLAKENNTVKYIKNKIIIHSKKYGVPSNVIYALAKIESNLDYTAINKKSKDYGILQVNQYNIKAYGFNKKQITKNIDYSIICGIIVFKWFYKKYPLNEAIGRFHCGTRKNCHKWKKTKKYIQKVKKYI